MPDRSSVNSEFPYCEFESDNDGEGVMMPPIVEQKPTDETITIDQSASNDVLDLNQEDISDTPTPTIPVIDLYSFVPTPPIRKDMANMVSQARKICDYYQPILNNLYSNIEQFGYCLSFQIYMEFAKFIEEVQKRMETWSDVLQQMAPFANCDSQPLIADMLEEINQIFEKFSNSNLLASILQKCNNAEWLQGLAVPFVGRAGANMDLDTALLAMAISSQQNKSQYVFFHNAALSPGPNTNECRELFNRLISEGERCIYVDTSLANVPSFIPVGDRIAKFFITDLANTDTDYVQETMRKMYTCIVRMEGAISSSNQSVKDTQKNEQFPLEIPCPKAARYGGACSNDKCLWECDDCGKLIYIRKPGKGYTHVAYFICDCGQVPLTGAKFRCKDVDLHGYEEFIEFPPVELSDQLRLRLHYYSEKNIIILGETGVGKSTWINAFANFLTFRTLQEAIQSEKPVCLIPTSFPHFDKNDFTERTITIGPQDEDSNESNRTGQSQTKMPKEHVLELKTGRMRMVDTPGMADTAGLQQDKQNFKHTLRYISTLKELNGIAILIDANQSRLTPAFKYCIGQLLTQLHKDAAKNIVFVFTKCGQRRHPRLALSSLRTYLAEVKRNIGMEVKTELDQVYRMENDAFKFIHEVNQGVEYTNVDYKKMESSWSLSKSESTRLLKHIMNLEPHKPMDTFSLNRAKSMASSSSSFTTSINNPQSSATSSGQSFNTTYGKHCRTANRWQQLQKQQQQERNIGDASGQPKSNSDVAVKEQNKNDKPSWSTSSKKIP